MEIFVLFIGAGVLVITVAFLGADGSPCVPGTETR
jgi:hypothetical protein